jgi:hypothetical protein
MGMSGRRDARLFRGRGHSPRGGGGHTSLLSQIRDLFGGKIFASCLGHGQRGLLPHVQRINPDQAGSQQHAHPVGIPCGICRGYDFPQAQN